MVSVPHPFVAKFDEARLREALRVVKHHPALLAYYLFDEPSPSKPNQAPADLQRVYDVIADEDLCERANRLGSRLRQRLEAIRATTPELAEVRGRA